MSRTTMEGDGDADLGGGIGNLTARLKVGGGVAYPT